MRLYIEGYVLCSVMRWEKEARWYMYMYIYVPCAWMFLSMFWMQFSENQWVFPRGHNCGGFFYSWTILHVSSLSRSTSSRSTIRGILKRHCRSFVQFLICLTDRHHANCRWGLFSIFHLSFCSLLSLSLSVSLSVSFRLRVFLSVCVCLSNV